MDLKENSTRLSLMFWVSIVGIVFVLLILLILKGYSFGWTGFGFYPGSGQGAAPAGAQREKTFWDWLDLLIIPLALAFVALGFSWIQSRNESIAAQKRYQNDQEISRENLRESALQSYLDKMTDLILDKMQNGDLPKEKMGAVARARTLSVLRTLDGERKGQVLRFLYDSEMLDGNPPDVDLSGADLSGALLHKADLFGAILTEVDLSGADLSHAYLVKADLSRSKLKGANLEGAFLQSSILDDVDFSGAKLVGADLTGAEKEGAIWTGADLTGAKGL